jgi:hypothetical protein
MFLFFFEKKTNIDISDQIRYFWQKTKLTEVDIRLRFFVASLVEGNKNKKEIKYKKSALFFYL